MASQATEDYDLIQVAETIWIAQCSLVFFAMKLRTRMTVLKLEDESGSYLLIHSPIRLTDTIRAQLDALQTEHGTIRVLVAPCGLHHVFIEPYSKVYADAETWCTQDVVKKRKDVTWTGVLERGVNPWWVAEGQLRLALVESATLSEAVFFVEREKVLLVVDLLENLNWKEFAAENCTLKQKMAMASMTLYNLKHKDYDGKLIPGGACGGAFQSPEHQMKFHKKQQHSEGCAIVGEWPFERVILAHGHMLGWTGSVPVRERTRRTLRLPRE